MRSLMRSLLLVAMFAVWAVPGLHAQEHPHNLSFEPVDMPSADVYRTGGGAPGPQYWQQRANYAIDVTLDPSEHRITGRQTIVYTNNSPQRLEHLWVQLDQNLFKPDSRGARIIPPDARFSGFFAQGGVKISNLQTTMNGVTNTPEYLVEGTRMRITLAKPVPANGGTVELSLDFSFIMPKYGADRMGRLKVDQGTVYQLAQWYPRMYVYDDVSGWNPMPYLGQGEWYLEYGSFDVEITVPREYIVAATGELMNPEDVLTNDQLNRLRKARTTREVTTIIGKDEVGDPGTRPDGEGPLTWHYKAENVRDFSWAASQAFIWDAAKAVTGDGQASTAMSFYPKEGIGTKENPGWEQSTKFTQHSIEFYSDFLAPYPYPVAINVAGIVAGMEYPQIAFCSVEARGQGLFGVTDHEFGHEWYPMIVGSDERRWPWMDEGVNTFMNQYSTLAFYDSEATNKQALQRMSQMVARGMRTPLGETPIMTYADRIPPQALGFLAYGKPAAGLMLLREHILGPERFDPAFRAYFDRWAYQHPKPSDFFRTIEDVAGEELDYFWRSWFYETDTFDQGVQSVTDTDSSSAITVVSKNEMQLPSDVQVTFADGSTMTRQVPVAAFYTSDTYTLTVKGTKTVQQVVIDPEQLLPDVDRNNNTWRASDGSASQGSGAGR
ncbi:M1 family metallopeptidase [Salisaeta longa]|uniref:M1 family metallopeptidase n=1 Tax=Salisaeta longa TaxID=503170 RepID=UPI00048BB6E7|nr:M1 family metallopeptidase [Salisaeta longa]